jgi:hypothetical protein
VATGSLSCRGEGTRLYKGHGGQRQNRRDSTSHVSGESDGACHEHAGRLPLSMLRFRCSAFDSAFDAPLRIRLRPTAFHAPPCWSHGPMRSSGCIVCRGPPGCCLPHTAPAATEALSPTPAPAAAGAEGRLGAASRPPLRTPLFPQRTEGLPEAHAERMRRSASRGAHDSAARQAHRAAGGAAR